MKVSSLLVLSLAACTSKGVSPPEPEAFVCTTGVSLTLPIRRKIDLLFVVDDSPAMASMEARLAEQLPSFMDALVDPQTNGFPNLHVGVVSSSLGAGRYANVSGCEPGGPGDGGGKLVHPAAAGLTGGDTFLRASGSSVNSALSVRDTFAALARLGHGGCRFPQPLAAARRALEKARAPGDPDNAGFLRDDAALMVAVITNGDDCSVPVDSDLFDPAQTRLSDPYGALAPYRCAEFGWTCGGVRPPHEAPSANGMTTLDACAPDSRTGLLTPLEDFAGWWRTLKTNPDDLLASVIGGPPSPVSIRGKQRELTDGTLEIEPEMSPSCSADAVDDTATPTVRLRAWANGFGPDGVSYPACAAKPWQALIGVAETIRILSGPRCLPAPIVTRPDGQAICTAYQTAIDERGTVSHTEVPACDDDRTVVPCWQALQGFCAQGSTQLRICENNTCSYAPTDAVRTVGIECQVDCSSPAAGRTFRDP